MRVEKDDPRQVYTDFTDWLRQHPAWLINVIVAYAYYLVTTVEV